MSELWNLLLYQPLLNALIFFYQALGNNLGLAIIALTGALRLVLVPLTSPSLKSAQKMKELSPELDILKKTHSGDKQALAAAQLDLYKKHGINPAAGCLPQIVQLLVLIALFNAFNQTLKANGDTISKLNEHLYQPFKLAQDASLNTSFLGMDLSQPNVFKIPGIPVPIPGLIVILAALSQFVSSKMMLPQAKKAQKQAEKTEGATDDMATAMQTQMLYMFPLMTLVIGLSFPAGLALYWFVFSLFSLVQQALIARK